MLPVSSFAKEDQITLFIHDLMEVSGSCILMTLRLGMRTASSWAFRYTHECGKTTLEAGNIGSNLWDLSVPSAAAPPNEDSMLL